MVSWSGASGHFQVTGDCFGRGGVGHWPMMSQYASGGEFSLHEDQGEGWVDGELIDRFCVPNFRFHAAQMAINIL